MALKDFCKKLEDKQLLKGMKNDLVNELHEHDEGNYSPEIEKLIKKAKEAGVTRNEKDKYYAILVMDGDNMGELVNGQNIASKWQDVIHPELVSILNKPDFDKGIWDEYIDQQRLLSPSVHTAISESLGTFSLYAVPEVVRKNNGKLIYAGGDDIAAVLPHSTVFDTAKEITELYNMGFVSFDSDGITSISNKADKDKPICFFLGGGENITISGAILICHHRQPLRGAIEEAHNLLDTIAKKKPDKNALAVKLQKRSGHSRIFAAGWDEVNPFAEHNCTKFESFQEIINASGDELLSSSLIYRLNDLKIAVMSIIGKESKKGNDLSNDSKEKIKQIIGYEVGHSGILDKKFAGKNNQEKKKQEALRLAGHLAGLILTWNPIAGKNGEIEFDGEIPVIAAFLS